MSVKTDYFLFTYILCTFTVLLQKIGEDCSILNLSVNDIPLFIYKNFLKSQVSKNREMETDSSNCYKGILLVPLATVMPTLSTNLKENTWSSKIGKNLYQHATGRP